MGLDEIRSIPVFFEQNESLDASDYYYLKTKDQLGKKSGCLVTIRTKTPPKIERFTNKPQFRLEGGGYIILHDYRLQEHPNSIRVVTECGENIQGTLEKMPSQEVTRIVYNDKIYIRQR